MELLMILGFVLLGQLVFTGGDDDQSVSQEPEEDIDPSAPVEAVGNADLLINGTTGNDDILGADTDQRIETFEGQDTVYAQGGDDTVLGRDDDDFLLGGDGDDLLKGGSEHDELRGENGNDDLRGGYGNDQLYGGLGDDKLSGGFGDDLLAGEEGDDTLFGADENDTLLGHGGSDLLNGGQGDDLIDAVHGGEENVGSGADEVIGGLGDDSIWAGHDDTVSGGAGDDLFYLVNDSGGDEGENTTLITDFDADEDQLAIVLPDGYLGEGVFDLVADDDTDGQVNVTVDGVVVAQLQGDVTVDEYDRSFLGIFS